MIRGLVVGKFLPFHLGHKALIEFANKRCNHLTVLVCASNRENLPGQVRAGWIRSSLSDKTNIEVQVFEYDEDILPNTSVSSRKVSNVWAHAFMKELGEIDMVFTSEPYGEYLAEYMGIEHILFDMEREKVPVSSSLIKSSAYEYWHFLSDPVKKQYQKKVVFLGTESTGKSSISQALSKLFKSTLVKEIGRDIIPDSQKFTKDDLIQVARTHANNIKIASEQLAPLVLIDTDIHITQSYSKFKFGEYFETSADIKNLNQADLYIYLAYDFPFQQDGTRLSEKNRNLLDKCHQETLNDSGINYKLVGGNWDERFITCLDLVSECLDQVIID